MIYCARLEQEALLHISGPDTLTFLQGQTTCDTRQVNAARALPGAYCTPQGRVVCDFLLCELGAQHHALRMRRDILEEAAATFGKYIVFSKAELDPEQGPWQVLACWGDDVGEQLRELLGALPPERYGTVSGDGFTLVQLDDSGSRFECYLDGATRPELAQQFSAGCEVAPESDWQALEIEAGMGRIEAATIGEFVPQMLNYDLTGHISFNKGCYTGQEVVARLHYRGTPKRRMFLARLPQAAPAGTALFGGDSKQSVGNVVNCADSGGAHTALVVATIDGADRGLHLASPDGPELIMGELPYSLSSD